MSLYIDDADFKLHLGDVREILASLPDESVDCVVTSPPYWGLRDYGADGQIGLEPTPDEYVQTLVEVFHGVRRVLAPHGTVWLNLGDSYAASRSYQVSDNKHKGHDYGQSNAQAVPPGLKQKDLVGIPWRVAFALQQDGWWLRSDIIWAKPNPMPQSVTDRPTTAHEYVFLLSKQPRYYFDQEAVREEFVTDRMPGRKVETTEHYGQENGGNDGLTGQLADVRARLAADRRPQAETLDGSDGEAPRGADGRRKTVIAGANPGVTGHENHANREGGERWPNGGRNIRSVWEITTQPYPDAHFATFPEALPERCIKAGCPEWVCRVCGKPRERIMERTAAVPQRKGGESNWHKVEREERSGWEDGRAGGFYDARSETVGWTDCGCLDEGAGATPALMGADTGDPAAPSSRYRRGVVLDPFMGSGTTALVARKQHRHAVGIELNPAYADLCAKRLQQLSLFA